MLQKELFIQLFYKYTAGTSTESEQEVFFELIRSNEYDSILSELMDDLYETIKKEDTSFKNYSVKPNMTSNNKKPLLFYTLAAAAIFIGFIAFLVFRFSPDEVNYKDKISGNIIQTPKAKINYILLPDSTQVWVNAATELHYPKQFAKDKREIYLEGEAFLDVRHADKVPFIVHLPGQAAVTVLGTAFNIKAFPDRQQLIVSVKRGQVSVSKNNKVIKILTVGQELKVAMKDNSSTMHSVDTEKISSWQTGTLYFNDMMLQDVVKDINQQKGVDIQIENERLGSTIINVRLDKEETVSEILNIIKAITDCNLREQNGIYILY